MNRLNSKAVIRIAKNLVDFMDNDAPIVQETVSFIYNWVRRPEGIGMSKGYFAVWDMVLKQYLPKERPVLFRSCWRPSNREIQSFTGRMYAAYRFSEGYKGHLLICDTKEYLYFEDELATEHDLSFFPLHKCIKKAASCFPKEFLGLCEKEDEYIVRVKYNRLYDLKWNKSRENNKITNT